VQGLLYLIFSYLARFVQRSHIVIITTFALPMYGLHTWRRELIGKRNTETAMALMKAVSLAVIILQSHYVPS